MAYLIPRDPFNISLIRRQMDELFDHFFPFSNRMLQEAETSIFVDVVDNGKEYVVKANVPGVAAKDLDVRVMEDRVVIKGSFTEEKEDKQQNYILRERRSGSFTRSIPLENIDPDKAKAKFKDGVLQLTIPKKDDQRQIGRQLEIEE